MEILIKNAHIITPYEILHHYEVAIEHKRISRILPSGTLQERDFKKVVDAKGNYLAPGFIDIHTHANFGHDTMEATYEALNSMAKFHIKNGVTSFLATTMTSPIEEIKKAVSAVADYMINYKEERNNLSNLGDVSAEILGIYLEGPYFCEAKKGAQASEYLRTPDIDELSSLIKLSGNTVRIVAIAPELVGAMDAIKYLHDCGITVSAGHTDATFDTAKKAFDNGVTQVTHIFNGMKNFTHREPGIPGAALIDERVYCEMICDGIHLHPAAMQLVVKAKGKDKIILISDSMMAAGLSDGEYTLGGQKVIVKEQEARLLDGTLAGSTLTLNKAIYNMVHMVGVSLPDAVRMASLNPARAIGIDNKKGSIEIGKDADLVIFDEDINILNVVKS